jgi:hypothetical protein
VGLSLFAATMMAVSGFYYVVQGIAVWWAPARCAQHDRELPLPPVLPRVVLIIELDVSVICALCVFTGTGQRDRSSSVSHVLAEGLAGGDEVELDMGERR